MYYFGADYYPEHWPRERWATDAKMMKEAGFNLIRVAEFGWAKLEPAEGQWDFGWLDEALDVFYKEGIQVVMGTPTATPPKWLMDKYPSIYKVDENGLVQGFGSRRHYCYNSDIYREYSEKIVEKMAQHYADHPAVAAWQIDNEFTAGDGLYCYCENCRQKFIGWLKRKYGSLDAVNKAWGTVFWSQTYTDWDQIIVPRKSQAGMAGNNGHNPGLNLDYSRFESDSIKEYGDAQIRILRRWSKAPITHNLVREEMDYYKVAENLDIATFDNYPTVTRGVNWRAGTSPIWGPAFMMDQVRGAKNKNTWMMEEQSGPCGWEVLGSTPRPGQIREWTYQMMAHGAESIVYFRWRACLFGTEMYWYGILDHDGIPRRRYREVQAIGAEMPKVAAFNVGSRVDSDILLIRSFEQQWSHKFQSHNWNFDYRRLAVGWHSALSARQYDLDVSGENTDFSPYKLVLAPAFNLMTDAYKAKFEDYVRNGGNLVVSFRSGTKNWDNSMSEITLPGYFKDVAGIELEEFDSLNDCVVDVEGGFGKGQAHIWADIIKPVTAKPLAAYASEYYAGQPAVTVNQYGKGRCYYIGCDLDPEATEALLGAIAAECGVAPAIAGLPGTVEAVRKQTADGRTFYFLLNPLAQEQTVTLPFDAHDELSGQDTGRTLTMPGYACYLLTEI